MNTEIEIKILLPNKDKGIVSTWLKENAVKQGEIHHVEYYLNNPTSNFFFTAPEGYKDAYDYLRIRLTDKGDSVCLKKWHRDPKSGKTTHCDEYETKVENGRVLLELYKLIGFTDVTLVDKTRTIYSTNDFEISIDSVLGLGPFMEVEVKGKVKDVGQGLENIYKFLKNLGFKKIKKMDRGYVSMLWNPDYDFGEEIIIK